MIDLGKKKEELQLKAAEFFNIPKRVYDDKSLKFAEKLFVTVVLEELSENGIPNLKDGQEIEDSFSRSIERFDKKFVMFTKEVPQFNCYKEELKYSIAINMFLPRINSLVSHDR